ncbi:MAG: chemotaxis-specific protein-glutamate methyltransferase CheB [Planctomycetes bacterium]|nr:chemotaxis-specific protein-glutamate methyltransferase CheB [Planctomycetota bacterium]
MPRIRVLVVEDSQTVRRHLVEVLAADPELEVVGEAADGETAIALCRALRPDVITLDLVLPGVDGLTVTEQVMAHQPTPILVVSAADNRGEHFQTYAALAAGALEVLEKPTGTEPGHAWERRLIARTKLVSRIKVITHLRGRLAVRTPSTDAIRRQQAARSFAAVAIGTSTGGPGALVRLLGGLDAAFPVPILAVIHIGAPFGDGFARWLDQHTPLRVANAVDGEPLPSGGGRVIIAPPDRHLVLQGGCLRLIDDAPQHSCRPSVDVLFSSLAALGARAIGCLLTGMGRDGAQGLLAMRNAGATTIAQDEATSVVFGMPREACEIGAAGRVLPLGSIAAELTRLVQGAAPAIP